MLFRIAVILLTLNGPVSSASLSLSPLWDYDANDTQPCRLEHRSDQYVVLQGSTHQTCSFQVNTSLGYNVWIEVPGSRVVREPFSFDIERQGDLIDCKNRYLVVYGNTESYTAVLRQNSFQLNVQSNIFRSV